jgi:hypothetical protein
MAVNHAPVELDSRGGGESRIMTIKVTVLQASFKSAFLEEEDESLAITVPSK